MPTPFAVKTLEFDDVGPEVAEDLGRERSLDECREIKYAEVTEGSAIRGSAIRGSAIRGSAIRAPPSGAPTDRSSSLDVDTVGQCPFTRTPPSTTIVLPVMNVASSDARNATAAATSEGCWSRGMMCRLIDD